MYVYRPRPFIVSRQAPFIFGLPGPIRFDNSSNSGCKTAATTYSWSHTCTGSNRALIVSVALFLTGTVSTVTYNTVGMTLVRADSNAAYRVEIWRLENPAAGANTVEVTLSGSLNSDASAVSYTGVDQATATEASFGGSGLGGTPTASVTTISVNAWVVDGIATADLTTAPASDQRQRNNTSCATGSGGMSDKGPILTPAATSMSWDAVGGADSWALTLVALKPFTGTVFAQALTATVTSTASIVKSVGKPMTATVTSTASIVKSVGKSLTATVTSTATIVRSIGKSLTATVTTTASVTKQVAKTLIATVTSTASQVATFIPGGAAAVAVLRTLLGLGR